MKAKVNSIIIAQDQTYGESNIHNNSEYIMNVKGHGYFRISSSFWEREGERIHSSLKSLKEAKREKRALNCLSTLHNDIFFYIKEGQKVKEIP